MKKLVFSLMVLFLTSENRARGSFFQLGLGYEHLNTCDIWAPNLIHDIKSNRNFKININLRILTINKTMKIFVEVSTGLSQQSLLLPKENLEEYIEWGKPTIYNLNKNINILNINLTQNNNSVPKNIFINSMKPGKVKNSYIINYKDLDKACWDNAEVKINDLFKDNNNNTFVYPYGITYLYAPISIGLSTKIKIHSKTYFKIGLYIYRNVSTSALYNYSVLFNLFLKNIDAETSSLNKDDYTNNMDALKSLSDNPGNFFLSLIASKKLIKFCHDVVTFFKFLFSFFFGIHRGTIPGWYGGIFNITICSKIYKHLEISILLISLECCYVKNPIGEEIKSLKQSPPFNGNLFVLFLHFTSVSISLLV